MSTGSFSRRFFHRRADFDLEMRIYSDSVLRHTLPPLHFACPNDDGALCSPSGWRFPPFLALERGVSLQEWLCTHRSSPAILHMVFDIAKQLVQVHSVGLVHRDLKPGRCMRYTSNLSKLLQPTNIDGPVSANGCDSSTFARDTSWLTARFVVACRLGADIRMLAQKRTCNCCYPVHI